MVRGSIGDGCSFSSGMFNQSICKYLVFRFTEVHVNTVGGYGQIGQLAATS
jgi:hypothetical protein